MRYLWWLLAGSLLMGIGLQPATASPEPRTENLADTLLDVLRQPVPVFNNINKIPYHSDARSLARIKKLEKAQDWPALYRLLKTYVHRFGIQNFYKDTYYLWRLAKLAELLGSPEEARMYYRLVLKHHRSDIDLKKIELHYNELNEPAADLYVPLEYYYELVEYRRQVDTLMPPRNVLLNMGANINSHDEDYGPALSSSDTILLFTSKRNKIQNNRLEQVTNEDLFYSRRYDDFWEEAQPFEGINSRYNEGSATLSPDGKTLVFSRCDSPDSYGSCDLFAAELQADGSWGNVKNLGVNLNSVAWDSHPSFTPSGDSLYFASDRIGGFGLADIWFTYKKDGKWQPAQNAGPVINTRYSEVSPFVHPRYNILYFSSSGQLLNFGEFDIYKSYRTGQQWGEPVNIGPLVNGEGSEFYFTIDADSRELFYAASKEEDMKNLDLYSFPLPMEAQPLATTKLEGSLLNEADNLPFKGIVSVVDLDEGTEIAPKFLREDGSFEFNLIKDRNYLLIIQGDNFFRIEEIFFLDRDMRIDRKTQPLSKKLEFTTIDFESGSATVMPEMYSDLNKLADFLIDHPQVKLKIGGHTDTDGDPVYNQKLSQRRAVAIMEYLVAFANVPAEQISAIGYGSSKPIIPIEKNEEDKKLNRRVEFELIWPSEQASKD